MQDLSFGPTFRVSVVFRVLPSRKERHGCLFKTLTLIASYDDGPMSVG